MTRATTCQHGRAAEAQPSNILDLLLSQQLGDPDAPDVLGPSLEYSPRNWDHHNSLLLRDPDCTPDEAREDFAAYEEWLSKAEAEAPYVRVSFARYLECYRAGLLWRDSACDIQDSCKCRDRVLCPRCCRESYRRHINTFLYGRPIVVEQAQALGLFGDGGWGQFFVVLTLPKTAGRIGLDIQTCLDAFNYLMRMIRQWMKRQDIEHADQLAYMRVIELASGVVRDSGHVHLQLWLFCPRKLRWKLQAFWKRALRADVDPEVHIGSYNYASHDPYLLKGSGELLRNSDGELLRLRRLRPDVAVNFAYDLKPRTQMIVFSENFPRSKPKPKRITIIISATTGKIIRQPVIIRRKEAA